MSEDIPVYASPPIKGYRNLTNREVEEVNTFKSIEETLLEIIAKMQRSSATGNYDQRFLAIGKTEMQMAFMALNRGVLRPGAATPESKERGDSPSEASVG